MSWSWLWRTKRLLADLAVPLPVNYFILVHRREVQLLRVAGKKLRVCLTRPCDQSTNTSDLEEFCRELTSSPIFYGQSIGVLLNTEHCYSFIKRYAASDMGRIRTDMKAITRDGVRVNHVVRSAKNAALVVAQGVDATYLEQVLQIVSESQLPVLYVSTLAAYVALNNHIVIGGSNQWQLFEWSAGSADYFAMKSDGSALYGTVPSGSSSESDAVQSQLVDTLFGEKHPPVISKLGLRSGRRDPSLAAVFKSGHTVRREDRHLYIGAPTSRLRRSEYVTSNSIKLLTNILGAVAVVLAAVWLAFLPSTAQPSAANQAYQTSFADNLRLKAESDSLTAIVERRRLHRTHTVDPAALVSLFCQERSPGLYLNGISIKQFGADSVTVEAMGMAKSSQSVFSYQKDVADLAPSMPLALLSIRPEVVTTTGQLDTLLSFRLGGTLNEISKAE